MSRSQTSLDLTLRLLTGVVAALTWLAPGADAQAERPQPDLKSGRAAYEQQCARCHGDTGTGDGLDAKRFYPRPRDLALGKYKFRTSATGTAPYDEDLFRTLTQGLPGTNMPDWEHLDEATRWQLVEYLKSLSTAFQEIPPEPVDVPPDPGHARVDLHKGRTVYEKLGCAACHGPNGRANGTSSAGLVDEWNMPIRPANLTQGWAYRGGSDPRAIVMRVLAGIDGSGMPSYAGAITPPEDVWPLAYYVASLQEPAHWHMIVHALHLKGSLPERTEDTAWRQAESTTLRVRNIVTPEGEWAHPPTIRALTLQVAYNEEAVAFRLSWDDPSQDQEGTPDALAMLLKPSGTQGDVVTLQTWPYAGAPALDASYWSAATQQAAASVITAFDQAGQAAHPHAPLPAAASYDDGRWSLVMQRPLQLPEVDGAAVIGLGEFLAVAFAVSDGGNAGARAVSPWVDVAFQPPTKSH